MANMSTDTLPGDIGFGQHQTPPPAAGHAMLAYGLVLRYGISCSAWCGLHYGLDRLWRKRSKTEAEISAGRRMKIWLGSYALDFVPSVLLFGGRFIAARHAHRLMTDFLFPSISDILHLGDRFDPGTYFGYARDNLFPPMGANWNAVLLGWQLPSIAAALGKLALIVSAKGWRQAPIFSALPLIGLQAFLRMLLTSFCISLPQSEAEIVVVLLVMGVEKTVEAYLTRNLWPFDDYVVDGWKLVKKEKLTAGESAEVKKSA